MPRYYYKTACWTWRDNGLKKHLDFGLFLSKNRSKCAIFEGCKNLCDSVRQTKFALPNNKNIILWENTACQNRTFLNIEKGNKIYGKQNY